MTVRELSEYLNTIDENLEIYIVNLDVEKDEKVLLDDTDLCPSSDQLKIVI